MRRVLDDPRRLRHLVPALIGLAASCGLVAALLRDRLESGSGAHSATYLLDTFGWLLAICGAVAAARLGVIFAGFQPRLVRRRAILAAVGGTAICLIGCVVLSTAGNATPPIRFAAAAALTGGLGAGLAGLLTLAVTDGSRFAADRLARLDDH